MKKFFMFLSCIFILLNIFPICVSARETSSYDVYIKTYQRNSIIVEFPQIRGMSDRKKQKEINYLLEREIFQYITDCFNDYWLDDGEKVTNILETISNTQDADLEFLCHPGIENDQLLSIRYAVYGYGHGGAHPNTWGYAYTIDFNKLKVIHLNDLIDIDDSFLQLNGFCILDRDSSPIPYKPEANLYETLNSYGFYSKEELSAQLDSDDYNKFYITKDYGFSFFFSMENHEHELEIKFEDVKQYLTPYYSEKLIFTNE